MKTKTRTLTALCLTLCLGFGVVGGLGVGRPSADTLTDLTRFSAGLLSVLAQPAMDPLIFPPGKFSAVKPQEFDPARTNLVQAAWLPGIGCPTNATIATPNADFTGVAGTADFTDPACMTGDQNDKQNEGLLLAKTGPSTTNFAAAAAELVNVKGLIVNELGYDIRKPLDFLDPRGSHCGGGAPRFIVVTETGGFIVIGCNNAPLQTAASTGWVRLRWMIPPVPVSRIVILFDEGQDVSGGPDHFGAAILDNISVNEKLVGRGATDAS